MKILFLLKGSFSYGYGGAKSGLSESSNLTSAELTKNFGVDCKVALCDDGNCLDKELFAYKPDVCVIEALWVTPEKLAEIAAMYKGVKFYVRSHSEIPFLSNEGIAVDWIKDYTKIPNVKNSFNSFVTNDDFTGLLHKKAIYLPNIFSKVKVTPLNIWDHLYSLWNNRPRRKIINIGCFGAIRPMKNQLIQAIAAIKYGDDNDKIVYFHINAGRQEQGGDSVLKNIRAAFKNTNHVLVEHGWLSRADFLCLIKRMDIGLQVSYSESFNIVAADFVAMKVPIVVSDAIRWMPAEMQAKIDVRCIAKKIKDVLRLKEYYVQSETIALDQYNKGALSQWKNFIYGN